MATARGTPPSERFSGAQCAGPSNLFSGISPRRAANALFMFSALFGAANFSVDAEARNLKVGVADSQAAVHLRAWPSNRSRVLAYIHAGTVVASSGPCNERWCNVAFKGLKGWVFRPYVQETTEPVTEFPVAEEGQAPPGPSPIIATAAPTGPEIAGEGGDPKHIRYSVVGLNAAAWLSIREQASDDANVLGIIPQNASGVEDLKKCTRQWCLVRYKGISGFVLRRFLAEPVDGASARYSVSGIPLEGSLSVFDFPGADANIVGSLPSYASGIVRIGDCDRKWCHVRYLGLVGWVATSNLIAEADAPPG